MLAQIPAAVLLDPRQAGNTMLALARTALALKTAYLCVLRSVEVRALTRDQIKDEGILQGQMYTKGGWKK